MEETVIKCATFSYVTWVICNTLLFPFVAIVQGLTQTIKDYKDIINYSYYKKVKSSIKDK